MADQSGATDLVTAVSNALARSGDANPSDCLAARCGERAAPVSHD